MKKFIVGLAVGGVVGYLLTKVGRAVALPAEFRGFKVERVAGGTTTRRNTGNEALDFWFYPVIRLTPDVNGDYTVDWHWANLFDGSPVAESTGPNGEVPGIHNTFTGLSGGVAVDLQLVDDRDPATTGRDPDRGGAIAIGDVDFEALDAVDGLWHSFQSNVDPITITSPSGESVTITGQLGPEDFKCEKVLQASFQGFSLERQV